MTLGALAFCLVVSISYNAYRQGIELDSLQVKVRTKVSPEVLFALRGPEEHPSCLETIEATIMALAAASLGQQHGGCRASGTG